MSWVASILTAQTTKDADEAGDAQERERRKLQRYQDKRADNFELVQSKRAGE